MRDLERWVDALAAELGLDPDVVDVAGVLDLARDAAHQVARPAAPVTTFVAGYVAALAVAAGQDAESAVDDAIERASAFALGWSAPEDEVDPDDEKRADGQDEDEDDA